MPKSIEELVDLQLHDKTTMANTLANSSLQCNTY